MSETKKGRRAATLGMLIHPDELSEGWIDRLVRCGIDVLGIHPPGGKEAPETLRSLLARIGTPRFRELIDYARAQGLSVEYELHAAGYLMPKDLFETHPHYFRMNEAGERVNDWNFCVSDPEALDLFAKRAAELALSLYGSDSKFYFWMDDGHDLHCHCPKCCGLSPSDQQMIALNAMLREIRKHIPQAKMAYLAYYDSLQPPEIVPAEGIFLEYAPMEKYTAKKEDAAERIAREKAMIGPLAERFGWQDAKVLEYWYDNSLYSRWKKPPAKFVLQEETMVREMREYQALGFDSLATFACFLGEDYELLHGDFDVAPFAAALE